MDLVDYRELIKRYNPPQTSKIGFAKAVDSYAKILKHNELSVSETIYQLYKDKETGYYGFGLERPPVPDDKQDSVINTAMGIAQAIGLFLFTVALVRVAVHFLG